MDKRQSWLMMWSNHTLPIPSKQDKLAEIVAKNHHLRPTLLLVI
jgi:hypothetical protein